MAKSRPGLPEGFEIKVDSPAQLGDYLDEGFNEQVARTFGSKQRARLAASESPEEPPRPQVVTRQAAPVMRPQIASTEPAPGPARSEQVLNLVEPRRRTTAKAAVSRRLERMQINLRPETQRMFSELVEFVQRYSVQEDAKASEIQDAMISVLHQARSELEFHDVPRRGQWGTPTARAFPTALGNAFARAIAASYAKSGRGEE